MFPVKINPVLSARKPAHAVEIPHVKIAHRSVLVVETTAADHVTTKNAKRAVPTSVKGARLLATNVEMFSAQRVKKTSVGVVALLCANHARKNMSVY